MTTLASWYFNKNTVSGVGRDLGDILEMAGKAFDGKTLFAHGAIDTLASKISIIPAAGKILYLSEGKIIINTHTNPPTIPLSGNTINNDRIIAALKINGITVDTTNIGIVHNASTGVTATNKGSGSGGSGIVGDGRFNIYGRTLAGDGIKSVDIENVLDNGNADATLSGWIEDSAVDPRL